MNIDEIKADSKVPLIKVKITEIKEIEEKGQHQFQPGTVEDSTGSISFGFWNEQVNTFKVGDEIVIRDGWCKEFQGVMILGSGKFGSIKKVEKNEYE